METERNAPRIYGVRVGLVSGLFALGQVLLSVAAAHGAEAAVRSMQKAIDMLLSGGIADPTLLIGPLVPMLVATYLAMLLAGLLCVWFAAQAGRMAAIAQGRRAGGARAGMWVWLVSSVIWIVASIIATLITNSDGTLSGVFAGTYTPARLGQELLLLLGQELLAALFCLGFCALAGAQGARSASLVAPNPFPAAAPPALAGYPSPGVYPYAPYQYPRYPPPTYPQASPGYPAGWTSPTPQPGPGAPTSGPQAYPPQPGFYQPPRADAPPSEDAPPPPRAE
jgi:hypothetical protein